MTFDLAIFRATRIRCLMNVRFRVYTTIAQLEYITFASSRVKLIIMFLFLWLPSCKNALHNATKGGRGKHDQDQPRRYKHAPLTVRAELCCEIELAHQHDTSYTPSQDNCHVSYYTTLCNCRLSNNPFQW